MPTEIRTDRLHLRKATMDDLEAFHSILSDPSAMAYWSTPPHEELEQSREWLQRMIAIPHGKGEDFAIEFEGRVVGKAGLYCFPEIGFILHPDVWGQGIATEALRLVLERAFGVHGLDKILADVDPRNDASLKLLTKLGFREVGRRKKTLLVGDQWCDSVDLSLSRDEFERLAQPPRPR